MTSAENNLSPEQTLERVRMLRYKVHERRIEEIWRDFTAAGFEPILIKGWAAAQFYPKPYEREFNDIDIVVAPERFNEAETFLKNSGKSHIVDLHRGARHHDTLAFEDFFSAAQIVRCGASDIRIPRVEDHLRILCVHWLTDGGAYREKLFDIYYAVANRSPDFDWERLLDVVSPTRRRWIICTIGLAHKYLGLPIDETPIAAEARDLPRWLTETVEREWRSDIKLQPLPIRYGVDRKGFLSRIGSLLASFRDDRRSFRTQIIKRLAPNPIHATVDVEGEFDERARVVYQLKNFFRRLSKLGLKKNR